MEMSLFAHFSCNLRASYIGTRARRLIFVVLSHALVCWAPRLLRLETLELYNGSPLEDEEVHASINKHCPYFNSLSIYTW